MSNRTRVLVALVKALCKRASAAKTSKADPTQAQRSFL